MRKGVVCGWNYSVYFGRVLIDNDAADKSLAKTDAKGQTLGKTLQAGIKTAAKWGAALGGAAIAGGTALFAMANKAAESTDRVDKLSQKLGMTSKGFQEWDYILSQNGASIDSMGSGMKTLTNSFDALGKGGKAATEAFDELGLKYADLEGLSQEEIFEKTIVSLQGMEDKTKRAALANQLLGRAGAELAPLLNGGIESVNELREQAHKLGIVLDEETVKSGASFTDSMDNIKRSLTSVMTKVGAEVMPLIQKGVDWVMENMPAIQKVVGITFEKIGQFVTVATDIFTNYLMPAFQTIFRWTNENWPAIQRVIKITIDTITEIVETFVDAFTLFWNKWGADITAVATNVFEGIKVIIETAIKIVQAIIKTVTALISGDWKTMWEGISDMFKAVWEGMKNLIPVLLEGIFNALRLSFTVFKSIGKNMFDMVWEGMKGVWSGISNWVTDKVKWLADKLMFWKKSSQELESNPSPTIKTSNPNSMQIPKIPGLAEGGTVTRGGRVLVGERAPEILNLPAGARVTPLDKMGEGKDVANIYITLDGKTLAKALRQPLADDIRVFAGIRA